MAETKITGAHVRMARAFLRWSIADLAQKADVGISTLQRIEAVDGRPGISESGVETTREWRASKQAESLDKIAAALGAAGITFLPDNGSGVGIRGKVQ
jgi:transcriptional regulator with XRE-family HTH domain